MTATTLVWIKFGVCAALIGFAGPVLVRYGDIIARRTGVSRTWIGLVLLATATSLPELFTGVSAVTVAAVTGKPLPPTQTFCSRVVLDQ